MRGLAALLLLAASMPDTAAVGLPRARRRPGPEPDPRRYDPPAWSVACPTCGAEVGKPCDRRTLGRYNQHMSRVKALSTPREQE